MSYDEYGSGWDPTSPNVARAVERYGSGQGGPQIGQAPWLTRHDDPDLMTRVWRSMFGQSGQPGVTSQPLAPPAGAQAMDPSTPFGGAPQAPPAPRQYKPASTISSNHAINERINRMLNGGTGPRVDPVDYPPPVGRHEFPDPAGAGSAPMQYLPMNGGDSIYPHGRSLYPPSDELPKFDLLQSVPFDRLRPGSATDMPGGIINMRGAEPPQQSWWDRTFGGKAQAAQGPSPFSRANGGPIPGFMRGGYPDLYGVDEPDNLPLRTFDSGGESYVHNAYSDQPGRVDDVNAKLSAREYVIDAETMALLGDGNPDAGAKKMDEFRQNVRKHKGAALAKGKISPDAKPAASSYIAGNPLGDGLRRRGREKG